MIRRRNSQDLFSCLQSYEAERLIDSLEKEVIDDICKNTYLRQSLELMHLFFLKFLVPVTENSEREYIFMKFKSLRFDLLQKVEDESGRDVNFYMSESTHELKETLCKPFSYNVSFLGSPLLHEYQKCRESPCINIMTVYYNRKSIKELISLFGKDTTSYYRWDHNPSFDLLKHFLSEKI